MSAPLATWNPARGVWESDQTSIICGHLMPYSPTFPSSGSMRSGSVYEQPTSAPRMAGSGSSSLHGPESALTLLPTPRTTDMNGAGAHGGGGMDLRTAVALMPTPRASRGGSATETTSRSSRSMD